MLDELTSRYTVHRHRFGWLVFGNVPVADMAALCRLVVGEQVHDQRIADYYQATLALVTVEDSVRWRQLVGLSERGRHAADQG